MKKIALLGSTGSIGKSTLQVVRHLKGELEIATLAAHSNIDLLEVQAKEFNPELVAVFDEKKAIELKKRAPHLRIEAGMEGLIAASAFPSAHFTMLAMSGTAGLKPALAAIDAGKQIGLANKEILVAAGELVAGRAKEKGIVLLPVDSEHSALFQCLHGEKKKDVRRLILTASGGAFRDRSIEGLQKVTVEEALAHPNWKMGPKVTIDSSTLLNKGLEMIEARWLFDVEPKRIDVVIHPQSVVHSLVEYIDGSIIAQMSEPDMILPIQYALTYPNRWPGLLPPFDFNRFSTLSFSKPDKEKFICLQLAIDAMEAGMSYPCFLNAANEILVERFIRKEFPWIEIGRKLEKLMSSHLPVNVLTLDSILSIDCYAREIAKQV